ncbi:exocyst complex component EXO70B1-like [Cicer arietinum]|uniref:Exocyst subunit Exo70 family protein n=1 Tax=Cicer arietinum TaxID=3827 RepID=A0A1S2XKF0_CICAR|nr:exocyst complex component EXO70B1-like [Cicer arietinum]
MNEKLNRVIWKQFMTIRQEVLPHSKSNIMEIDDIIDNLHKTVKNMVEDGFQTECCKVYNIFRSRFINKCLCKLGLQEVNLCDVENENIENLISDFNIALRILLPNERRVWNHIFSMYSFEYSIFSSLEWRRIEIELWAKFMVLETRIHGNSSHEFVHDSGVHPLTREEMKCIKDVCEDHRDVVAHFQILEMIQLLESNLDAKSKINKNSALGYLFMLNNNRYIQLEAKYGPLLNLLGKEWTQIQTSKVRRNIKHYIKCSWNKVLNLLENDESMTTNVAIESMRLFHINFSDICKAQSICFVIDERLRKTMRKYLKKMLLPLYENFIRRFQDVVGKDVADQYIKYGMSDIEDRINHLFLEMKETTPVTGHHSYEPNIV